MSDPVEDFLLENSKGVKPKQAKTSSVDPVEEFLTTGNIKAEAKQPSAEITTPKEYGNPSPVVTTDPTIWTDKVRAGIEAAGGTVTSIAASVPGIPYGVFNHLYKNAVQNAGKISPVAGEAVARMGMPGLGLVSGGSYDPNAKPSTLEDDVIAGIQAFTPNALMPQSSLGQKYQENVGSAMQGVPVLGAEANIIGAAPQLAAQFARAKLGTMVPGKEPVVITPLTKMAKENGITPELSSEIAKHEQSGNINPVVAKRHIDADSLPEVTDDEGNKLKIRLTKGMATQDSKILSDEKNARSVNDPVRKIMDDNGKAMPLVLQQLQRQVASDINFRTAPEEGQFYIDKLLGVRQRLHEQTKADYQALHDAAEQSGLTHTPLDASQFATMLQDRFSKQGLYHEDLPPAVNMRIQKIASGELPLTFNSFEQLRTILGREQRKAASGTGEGSASAAHAVGEVRDVLENLPLTPEAQVLKPLADKARASAKQDFDLQNRSPAYKAVVEETAMPDDFVQKFILGKNKNAGVNQVQNLLAMFPEDKEFHKALAWSAINDIYGESVNAKGQLSSAKLDKAISSGEDSGKHQMLIPVHIRDGLDRLNKTAQLVQGAPAGAYIQTNPNLAATLAHYANSGMANAFSMIPGIGRPAVNLMSGMKQKFQEQKFATESTKIGAGLNYGKEEVRPAENRFRAPQEAKVNPYAQSAPTLAAELAAQNQSNQ